jgi:hypothetical protein
MLSVSPYKDGAKQKLMAMGKLKPSITLFHNYLIFFQVPNCKQRAQQPQDYSSLARPNFCTIDLALCELVSSFDCTDPGLSLMRECSESCCCSTFLLRKVLRVSNVQRRTLLWAVGVSGTLDSCHISSFGGVGLGPL